MRSLRKVLGLGVLLAVLFAGIGAAVQREQIADWLVLRDYHPAADITKLATDTGMTATASHYFYVNKPKLEGRTTFNQACRNITEKAAVLGCYHGNRRGIYIYAVADSRLNGVTQVTAAHEMLHQAYDRLSSGERTRVNGLLEDFYQSGLVDEEVKSQLDTYRKTEPDALVNEMHSLFATEVNQLSPELENYYARYFPDRSKVIKYYQSYQGEFTQRRKQVAAYDEQLASLKAQIEAKQKSLESQQTLLKQKKSLLDAGRYTSVEAYNVEVNAYNSLAQAYNQELALTRNLITTYNQIVEKRNAIAVQEQELQQALDSRLTPVSDQ